MKRYSENEKPFVYAAFSGLDAQQAMPILQKIEESDVSVWFSDGFSKKEIRRLEAAYSCVIVLSRHAARDEKVRRCIQYAVRFNKKILCIYLEPTPLSPGLDLLLNALQSINRADYPDEAGFFDKLLSAEVFSGMQVTAAQKRFARRRGLASVFVPIAAAAVIMLTVVYPLLIAPSVLAASGSLSKVGFGNLSLSELAAMEELNVVGDRTFDQWCYAYYTSDAKDEVFVNEISDVVPTGNISDITDLALLKNVKVMTFAANQVSDITPIYRLKSLEWLALNCNPITSIEGIEALQNLVAVSVSGTEVSDISPLFDIPSLVYLSFEYTYVNSIEGIERLPHLLGFNPGRSNLTDLSPLNRIDFSYVNDTEGFRFAADESLIQDFSPLQRIPKFRDLIVTIDRVDRILPYVQNKYVHTLLLRGSDIRSIEELSSLEGLEVLYLNDSRKLTSLEGIDRHRDLTEIELMNCPNIRDFSPLLELPNLNIVRLTVGMEPLASAQLAGAPFEILYVE
ncbi:MAG: hypothetical protein GX417_11355 [Clostridiales bacterium]|nr:hypothetical protein [Clostridiales bacterium]